MMVDRAVNRVILLQHVWVYSLTLGDNFAMASLTDESYILNCELKMCYANVQIEIHTSGVIFL